MSRLKSWLALAAIAGVLGVVLTQVPPTIVLPAILAFAVAVVGLLASRELSSDQLRLWVLLFGWILYFLSGVSLRIRGASEIETSVLDSAAALRVVLVSAVGLIVLAVLFGANRHGSTRSDGRLFGGAIMLMAYGGFALLSSLWSVSPLWTGYKSAEYLVGLAVALSLAFAIKTLHDLEVTFRVTWGIYIVLLGLVWIGFLVAPSRAMIETGGLLGWRLGGVFPVASTNTVGDLAATVLLVALVRLAYGFGSRRIWMVLLVAAGGALFLSQARSALLGVVLALVVLSVLLPKMRKQGALLAVAFGAMGYVFVELVYSYLVRGQSVGNIASLSGRTLYWNAALELWREHPIVGAGAYAAGRFGVLQELGEQLTSSLHNTWIEVLVGTGIIGVAMVGLAVIVVGLRVLRMARAEMDSPLGHIPAEMAAVLLLELARSLFTSGAFIWHPATRFLLAVTLCACYAPVAASIAETARTPEESVDHEGSPLPAGGPALRPETGGS